MVSIESLMADLAEIQGRTLILMQEGDDGTGFQNVEQADELYDAYELIKKAIQSLDRARMYEAGN
jgi:hypothetical protein